MKRKAFDGLGFLISWFAVIFQLILLIKNSEQHLVETLIRFFSYFTILTNLLVALYFTARLLTLKFKNSFLLKKGSITALTVFILTVGIVYQIILRFTWEPTGFQMFVDELLHSVIPLYFLVYWFYFAKLEDIGFKSIKYWILYPLLYFAFILIRGHFSTFYPYPFIDVGSIGYHQTFINFVFVCLFVCILYMVLSLPGKKLFKKRF
jgi:hypothetical protein